jgi:hypothetical protein
MQLQTIQGTGHSQNTSLNIYFSIILNNSQWVSCGIVCAELSAQKGAFLPGFPKAVLISPE